jgi:hypothetical protein
MRRFFRELALPGALFLAPTLAPGCAAPPVVEGGTIALDDPLGLVDDVAAAGNPLRVYVLPAGAYPCNDASGTITPDIPDLPAGMVADALVDVEVTPTGAMGMMMGSAMAMVPPGDYTVLVRGKGTDRVTGIPNTLIATGCGTAMGLASNETRSVPITLHPVAGSGVCGDTIFSPDEQCDSSVSGMMSLADCSMCRTTPQPVNVTVTMGTQGRPHVAAASGQRVVLTFDTDNDPASSGDGVGLRFLDKEGATISLGVLMRDDTVDDALGSTMALPQGQTRGRPAVAADGRVAITLLDERGAAGARVAFFSADRAPQGAVAFARTDMRPTGLTLTTPAPGAAFDGSGAFMMVFEDTNSATGISGRVFAAGMSTPSGAEAFAVGSGSGGTSPVVAGLASGFVAAWISGGHVQMQRFGADGTAMGMPAAVETDGMPSEPAIATSADGSFLIAWTERNSTVGDGNGATIRARSFAAAGTAMGNPFIVETTTMGDQIHPSVAAADGRYLVAWQSGTSIRARVVTAMGTGSLNREKPPTTNDFEIAATGNNPGAAAIGQAIPAWIVAYDDGRNIFSRRIAR